MNVTFKPSSIRLDKASCMNEIRNYLIDYFRKAEERLIEQMKQEVMMTTYGDSPGKPSWREDLKDRIAVVDEKFIDAVLQADIGINASELKDFEMVRAMIIAEGSGDKVGNPPITAGPAGRIVWNDAQDGQKKSQAKAVYALPETFNQTGNHFISNAVKRSEFYQETLEAAWASIPSSVFFGNISVTKG